MRQESKRTPVGRVAEDSHEQGVEEDSLGVEERKVGVNGLGVEEDSYFGRGFYSERCLCLSGPCVGAAGHGLQLQSAARPLGGVGVGVSCCCCWCCCLG